MFFKNKDRQKELEKSKILKELLELIQLLETRVSKINTEVEMIQLKMRRKVYKEAEAEEIIKPDAVTLEHGSNPSRNPFDIT